VNVRIGADGRPALSHHRRGDSAALMLEYVGYDLAALRTGYRQRLAEAGVDATQAAPLLVVLEAGLDGYTYLASEPAPAP